MRLRVTNFYHMYQRKTIACLAAIALLFASCKKESIKANNPEEDCVEQRASKDGEIIQGQYIVAVNSPLNGRIAYENLSDLSSTILERNHISDIALQQVYTGEPGGFIAKLSAQEAAALRADPFVSIIEPDRIIALSNCFKVVEPSLITWNVNRVGYGNGVGKTAWIIDSGIDFDHPDLTVDVTKSRSFVNGLPSADDANGHGTHVAGIIGAKNNSIGVLGVASGANLVSLRVLDPDGVGSLSSIIQALGFVNTNGKAGDVVNLSLGEEGISEILDDQVQNTANRGIFIAIAAGNDHVPAIQFSPARVNGPNIFTVSAIDSLDRFASFSNYGNDVVDFAAPGVRIPSTYSNGRYAILSGTSMAAPHVAGLLLLNGRNINSSGTVLNDPDGVADAIAHQ